MAHREGINRRWLKETYANFIQVEIEEPLQLGDWLVTAYASTLVARSESYTFAINEGTHGMYVHKMKDNEWVKDEIYRDKQIIKESDFYYHLQKIEKMMDEYVHKLRVKAIPPPLPVVNLGGNDVQLVHTEEKGN
jgi:hypothetical protein